VVVEFALFPKAGQVQAVSLDKLMLRVAGADTAARPSSATVISAALQKDVQKQRDVTVAPAVTVGYQTGTIYDPTTGTVRGGGVYTGAGVGVGIGQRGNQPGASEKDFFVMETEPTEKGLPEGDAVNPVAGYVTPFNGDQAMRITPRVCKNFVNRQDQRRMLALITTLAASKRGQSNEKNHSGHA